VDKAVTERLLQLIVAVCNAKEAAYFVELQGSVRQ